MRAFRAWRRNNPAFLAAGVSYYTVFSMIPTMIIALAIAGRIFQKSHAQAALIGELANIFNPDAAASIQSLLTAQKAATTATIFGVVLLMWAASHVFASLQHVMNIVWEVPEKSHGIRKFLKHRLKAFAMIPVFCLALAVFLSLDVGLAFVKHHLPQYLPPFLVRFLIETASYALYLSLFTVIFAMTFKFLPETRIAWRDVWRGAFFSAAMFAIARTVIALYFSLRTIRSFYGAAGSVIVLLIWVYFSTQIFLFGAEFTHVYSLENSGRKRVQN